MSNLHIDICHVHDDMTCLRMLTSCFLMLFMISGTGHLTYQCWQIWHGSHRLLLLRSQHSSCSLPHLKHLISFCSSNSPLVENELKSWGRFFVMLNQLRNRRFQSECAGWNSAVCFLSLFVNSIQNHLFLQDQLLLPGSINQRGRHRWLGNHPQNSTGSSTGAGF